MNKGTIAIRLDPETRAKLEILAQATGHTRSFIVGEAVRLVVDSEYSALLARTKEEGSPKDEEELPPVPERWNLIV